MKPTPLQLSFFTSARDNQPKPLEATWAELVESLREPRVASCTPETCKRSECTEKHGPAWSPASYPAGASRARGSVIEVAALVLDIDHISTDDQLVEILDRIPFRRVVHASHSDKPGDRCIRVVVALDQPVPGSEWPRFWQLATESLGVPADPATKDASRLYFLPSRPQGAERTEFGDGTDYLYATTTGPALEVGKILSLPPKKSSPTDVGATPTQTSSATGRQGALEALASVWPQTQRHQASLALAGALAHADWQHEDIAQFLHDLMDLVYGKGQDPSYRKRDEQALSSYNKKQSGEPVAGWPSLIQHVGEQPVQTAMKALGIGGKPQWLQNILSHYQGPQKATQDQLIAHYKANRARLLRQRTNVQSQIEAKALGRVLDHEQPAEAGEDRTQALVNVIRTLVKYIPREGGRPDGTPTASFDQIAQLLAYVFPIDIGQDANKPWLETLNELVTSCSNVLEQEKLKDGEFVVEVAGLRVGKPVVNYHNLDVALKKMGVTLKYDEFADRELMVRSVLGKEPIPIEDHHVISLRIELEETFDFKPSKDEFFDFITHTARKNSFHPVRDYLDQLEWDGVPRLHNWLITYGQAPDTEYTKAVGRLVLVAAVRRVRQPGCKFDEMLILEGDQGVQKSTALQVLCPDSKWFTDDLPLNADTKRLMESTGGKWIIEAGELKGMSKGDVANLKSYLSRTVDKARMAYGRKEKIMLRQFIIVGTTNDAQYLRDPTGLRRFWPITILFFDTDALARDRDQLWAEASHYEAQGESIRLAPSYYGLAAEEQEERRVVDTIETILEDAFHGHQGRIKTLDVWALLGKDPVDAKGDEQVRVGESMKRLGWERKRRRVNSKPMWFYIKGDNEDDLVVSGRKVIKAVGAQAGPVALPGQTPPPKVPS